MKKFNLLLRIELEKVVLVLLRLCFNFKKCIFKLSNVSECKIYWYSLTRATNKNIDLYIKELFCTSSRKVSSHFCKSFKWSEDIIILNLSPPNNNNNNRTDYTIFKSFFLAKMSSDLYFFTLVISPLNYFFGKKCNWQKMLMSKQWFLFSI